MQFYEKDMKRAAEAMLAESPDASEKLRAVVLRCIRQAMVSTGPGGWWLIGPKVRHALIAAEVLAHIGMCEEAGERTWQTAADLALIVSRLVVE